MDIWFQIADLPNPISDIDPIFIKNWRAETDIFTHGVFFSIFIVDYFIG